MTRALLVCLVIASPAAHADRNTKIVGGGDFVLTSKRARSWAEARAGSITSVGDGDDVYIYIRTDQPLGTYGAPISNDENIVGHDRQWLWLEVGELGNRDETYNTCVFALTPQEEKQTEATFSLAPGDIRAAGGLDCWLKTIGHGSAGTWKNELRLITMRGQQRAYIQIHPLTANVSGGVAKYKKLAAQYQKRNDAGDVSFNAPPPKVDVRNKGLEKEVMRNIVSALGEKPTRFYFSTDEWTEQRNRSGQLEKTTSFGVITYREGKKCFYEMVDIDRSPQERIMGVSFRDKHEIECSKL